MSALDYKKTQKDIYQPKNRPSIIDIPEMVFIMVDGKGDPNDPSGAYSQAVGILYGLSYTIKMGHKEVLEYVVPPLEGLWSLDDDLTLNGDMAVITDKSKFCWTSMIRQPDFVTPEIFAAAQRALQKKKPALPVESARLKKYTEGLCAQVMHIGPYDDEPATIEQLNHFITESGYCSDFTAIRRHHEIYLGDPRKTAPDKLKTIIRYPIVRA